MELSCSKINKLPEEVLLEIFDSYRRVLKYVDSYQISMSGVSHRNRHEHQPVYMYERRWNRKHGWFKLVHVCRKWRRIVLGSPSRLDLSLVLIEHNPGHMKTVYTTRLPSLPIRIDYAYGTPTNNDVSRVVAALKQRDRVRGIVFKGQDLQLGKVFGKMKCSFPVLERLDICHSSGLVNLKLPPTFLRGSAPRLRRLKMSPVSLKSISQLLSSATALVELYLNIDTIFGPSPTSSLIAYLQAMPCLRWLTLKLTCGISHNLIPESPENGGKIVPLSKLTFFHFYGHQVSLDGLMSGLSAPSLETFNTKFPGSFISPMRHISRFVTDTNSEHHAFRVISSSRGSFSLSLMAHSECIDEPDPHFNFYSCRVMQISTALSPRLGIVEELFLISFDKSSRPTTPWRRFLELFHNVKILRLQHNVMFDIAHSLQQDQGVSAAVLPSLEEIELRGWSWSSESAVQDERRSAMEAFGPFMATLQQAGRPVKIFWSEVRDVTWKGRRDF